MCGRILFDQSALRKHILTHTGQRDFSCPVCQRAFIRKDHMRRHMRKIHATNLEMFDAENVDSEQCSLDKGNVVGLTPRFTCLPLSIHNPKLHQTVSLSHFKK